MPNPEPRIPSPYPLMWTYILRRLLLMIPTLLGVTIISFCVMQLAPGDPLENQFSGGGTGRDSETREAYLLRRRELKLDRPLVLNFNEFRDYRPQLEQTAFWLGRTEAEGVAELSRLAAAAGNAADRARLEFLRSLKIDKFDALLQDPDERSRLAHVIHDKLDLLCRDISVYGVSAAVELLKSPSIDLQEKIGLIACLNFMVPDPLVYTYSRDPKPAETPLVTAVWQTWWQRADKKYPPLAADDRAALSKRFAELVQEPAREKVFEQIEYFDEDQMRFFAEKLLDPASSLRERFLASLVLRSHVPDPVPLTAPPDAPAARVDQVAANWLSAYYQPRRGEYEPGLGRKLWDVVADTQYMYMVRRLMTFDFGQSTLKLHEPVSEKIWRAAKVTIPLMFFSESLIYLVAVPLGIFCAVWRGLFDRIVSLLLFLLYSIPDFVAGMLFLVFFCYGDYLKVFPMQGLHSEGFEHVGLLMYLRDYAWHAALPVVCLGLFSLASLAMYGRSAMLDVIGQDYIRTARSKGLSEGKVVFKHALRNALIPIITLFAAFLPAMLGGSVLIEVLFNIPGMGRLGFESILLKDIPTLMAMLYIDAILVMVSILITDLLYVVVDPRISFAGQGQSA